MKHLTTPKNISTAISRAKKMLIDRANKNGIYENFGDKEQRIIEDRYINISSYTSEMNRNRNMFQSFADWCATYTNP